MPNKNEIKNMVTFFLHSRNGHTNKSLVFMRLVTHKGDAKLYITEVTEAFFLNIEGEPSERERLRDR